MSMRVLITGATGMLGQELVRVFSQEHKVYGLSRVASGPQWLKADLFNENQWEKEVRKLEPHVIINSAASTDVEWCEKNPEAAKKINSTAVHRLAKTASQLNSQFVQISTDGVFDGKSLIAYTEDSQTHPINEYGRTKLKAEALALEGGSSLVLRTNIFGWRRREPLSFGEWVLSGLRKQSTLTMFTDVDFTPLFTGALAQIVFDCVRLKLTGLFHAGASDVHSKYDFAMMTAEAFGLDTHCIQPIEVKSKGLSASRANHMALNSIKLQNLLKREFPSLKGGIQNWKESEHNGI